MKKNRITVLLGLSGLFMVSSVRYLDNIDSLTVDILSHFLFQYALIAFALLSYSIWKKMIPFALFSGLLFVFNLSAILDIGESIQATEFAGAPFKVYSANVHFSNDELSKLNREIQKIDPEILLLLEVTSEHVEQIRSVIQTYPYHIERRSLGKKGIGFVLLSKFPILNNRVTILSEVCNFVLEAMLDINQKPVMFYGVHARRPDKQNFIERKNQFLRLARQIKEQSLPVIVAGDFNATPYSPIFRELVKISGLKDSRVGFGWQPSWPTFFPPLWIPIDHVLVTPDIHIRKRTTGSYIGSDHYPVIAELSLR